MRDLSHLLKTKNHTCNTGNTGNSGEADPESVYFPYSEKRVIPEIEKPEILNSLSRGQKPFDEISQARPQNQPQEPTEGGEKMPEGKTTATLPIVQPGSPGEATDHKPESLPTEGKTPVDNQTEYRCERAAIMAFCGNLETDISEARAILAYPCSCGGRRFWLSNHGVIICGTCCPPAMEKYVRRWVDVPEAGQ